MAQPQEAPTVTLAEQTHENRVATPHTASLRELRQQRGWSLRRLADLAGTNAGYLSQLETGQRLPTPHVLAGLSHALDVAGDGWRIRVVLEHGETP